MGLTNASSILDTVSGILKSGLLSDMQTAAASRPKTMDMSKYFKDNTLEDLSLLSDDDLLTLSMKDGEARKAVFVRLGDLKKFLKS